MSAEHRLRIYLENSSISLEEGLAKLANHADHKIRLVSASHPNTPLEVLHELKEDEHPAVSKAARCNINSRTKKNPKLRRKAA